MKQKTRCLPRRATAVLAMALVLMTAAAMAVGLNYSRQVEIKRIAREAVMQNYGLNTRTIAMFAEQAKEDNGTWTVTYSTGMKEPMGEYTVQIGPDGKAHTAWSLENEPDAWGQAEIEAYMDGKLEQYRQMTADENLAAVSTAEPVCAPNTAQIIESADRALVQTYGFTAKGLKAFQPNAVCLDGLWTVTYTANEWHWPDGLLRDKTGEYTVILNEASGEVVSVSWSLADAPGQTVTPETLGQASVYSAACMEWVEEIRAEHERIHAANEMESDGLSVEEKAYLDGLMIQAGFDPARFNHVLPSEGDLTYEQAVELAARALEIEFGVSRDVFDASVLAYADLLQKAEGREWYFWVQNADQLCSWTVLIDAESGQILDLGTDSLAAGNG